MQGGEGIRVGGVQGGEGIRGGDRENCNSIINEIYLK